MGQLTPTAKKSVKARDPKYASENGIRSAEQMCFRSSCLAYANLSPDTDDG